MNAGEFTRLHEVCPSGKGPPGIWLFTLRDISAFMCYFSYIYMHVKEDSKENAAIHTHSSLHKTNFIVFSIWEFLKSRSHGAPGGLSQLRAQLLIWLRVMKLSPTSGSMLSVDSSWDSLSVPHLAHALFKWINKVKKKKRAEVVFYLCFIPQTARYWLIRFVFPAAENGRTISC